MLLGLLGSRLALAAACCGGASNVPTIISGDDRLQLSASVTLGGVPAEAATSGVVQNRPTGDLELRQGLQLDGAALLSDRFQASLSVPIVRRGRFRSGVAEEAVGLGDVSLGLAYELVPQWEYSVWKPKVFVFTSLSLPTGRSTYDSSTLSRVDVHGRGFFSPGVGFLVLNAWGNVDALLSVEAHHGIPRTLENSAGRFVLEPGWGLSASVGGGWNPGAGPLRIGLSLSPYLEQGVRTTGAATGTAADTQTWTASMQLSYMFESTLSGSLIYSDQTLLGSAQNAALSRSVMLRIQKRWER